MNILRIEKFSNNDNNNKKVWKQWKKVYLKKENKEIKKVICQIYFSYFLKVENNF